MNQIKHELNFFSRKFGKGRELLFATASLNIFHASVVTLLLPNVMAILGASLRSLFMVGESVGRGVHETVLTALATSLFIHAWDL